MSPALWKSSGIPRAPLLLPRCPVPRPQERWLQMVAGKLLTAELELKMSGIHLPQPPLLQADKRHPLRPRVLLPRGLQQRQPSGRGAGHLRARRSRISESGHLGRVCIPDAGPGPSPSRELPYPALVV